MHSDFFFYHNNISSKIKFFYYHTEWFFFTYNIFFCQFLCVGIVCLNNSLYCIGSQKKTNKNLADGFTSPTGNFNSMANTPGITLFTEIQDLFDVAYF